MICLSVTLICLLGSAVSSISGTEDYENIISQNETNIEESVFINETENVPEDSLLISNVLLTDGSGELEDTETAEASVPGVTLAAIETADLSDSSDSSETLSFYDSILNRIFPSRRHPSEQNNDDNVGLKVTQSHLDNEERKVDLASISRSMAEGTAPEMLDSVATPQVWMLSRTLSH